MTVPYNIPAAVRVASLVPRPLLTTPDGGRVALDPVLYSLWQHANQRGLDDIVSTFPSARGDPLAIRAGLACLAEAGLLFRSADSIREKNCVDIISTKVSVVIVAHNSQEWLPECFASLAAQSFSPLEIILVDNGSNPPAEPISPSVTSIRIERTLSLASAINIGVRAATGEFILLLNPDTILEPNAISKMIETAKRFPDCAAVAAKLRFAWARQFINGLGNYAASAYWSTDNGLGHLDLGQFEDIAEIPSACFAATLITRDSFDIVGELDENFPLYYEDSEWCYRARMHGYHIYASPGACVYHALGSRPPFEATFQLSPSKLKNVTYGRLRFAIKLLPIAFLIRFLAIYLAEDLLGMASDLLLLRGDSFRARANAWLKVAQSLPSLLGSRREIRARRKGQDKDIFGIPDSISPPLMWHGIPELTWDLVVFHYLPLILNAKTHRFAEFRDVDLVVGRTFPRSYLAHAKLIWKTLGARIAFYRLGRFVQWQLARIK